jgi:hypothetical protein
VGWFDMDFADFDFFCFCGEGAILVGFGLAGLAGLPCVCHSLLVVSCLLSSASLVRLWARSMR